VLVDGADHRDHDRGEEDEEAPEDGGVDEARDDPLKQLPLPEHDYRLVANTLRNVLEAVDRLPEPDQLDKELGAPVEQESADRERSGEGERSRGDVYGSCAFPRSAMVAARSGPRFARSAIRTAPSGALP
jgi:hypothetical protein